jgi:hypothetical protein
MRDRDRTEFVWMVLMAVMALAQTALVFWALWRG